MNQINQVISCVTECINSGMVDKQRIYDEVENKTGLPRPTIRRGTSILLIDLKRQVEILGSIKPKNIVKPTSYQKKPKKEVFRY